MPTNTPVPTNSPEPAAFTCARRELLLGAGAGGIAVLAACGSSGSSKSQASAPSGRGSALIALSDVPTDSAVAVPVSSDVSSQGTLLLTRQGGKLTALDATCTHMMCKVGVSGSELACPCHGSHYTLTGQVTAGPAPAPLHPVAVMVVGGQVELA